MEKIDLSDEKVLNHIRQLIQMCGEEVGTYEADLVTQQIQNSLKLMRENHTLGQLKLMTRAMREMRHAYSIFNAHPTTRMISIFGSARTPEDHPDYIMARSFSEKMAFHHWMCITGAANGIMKAGLDGQKPDGKFGLSILLPFESPTTAFIEGDPRLMFFRYFFTRKLMFMSHADAVAVFPGGYGTQDELFESLTLMQTGKGDIIPVVLLEGEGGDYWNHWQNYVQKNLFDNGWVSEEDRHLYHIATSVQDAVDHVIHFYKRYHSSRYVKDEYVIRLKEPLTEEQVSFLSEKFKILLDKGAMRQCAALPEENEFLELPRLVFHHNHRHFGTLRKLIDTINNL
jgi:uncharacterized protein (TIGR00730 family)